MNKQSKTILILEDEKPIYEVIKYKLEAEGFNTVIARSMVQAVDYLENGVNVDFVWLDHYLLGKENGLDFVSKLKQKGSVWRKLPVFVVSNTVLPEKIRKYLKLGVEKCYTKVDFRLDQIVSDIKIFLK
jgi:CheY-like chemotaxis protein